MCSQSPGAVSQFQHNSPRHRYQTISCALVPPYITQGRCLFHNPYPQYGDRRSIHEYLRSTSVQGRGIWFDRSKNDDFQKHSLASLIKNKVKPQSPRALLDSIRTDIPASKVAQVESQNGDTYTTKLHKNLKDERTLASSIERSISSEILNQAAQTAEFNKALGAQRSSRERYLNDYWKRQHEAPVASPQRQGTVDGNQDFNYAQLALQQAEASRVQDRGQLVVSTSNNLNANQAMGAFGSIGTPQP
ncbi:uncharacterized protein K441DRAFT_679643 [Cenococcum geophilum 1.58]|uniref:uncharacterized protein n=1 Tax=Cenococcum geophilum 1.58 TaxID=794803 RepID=UPI00358EE6EF|nr:hypothetical protein K441DRAFT_679643 [Cenococcum geophilum 1.58]